MSKTTRFLWVGAMDLYLRSDFPLICGCCGKDIPLSQEAQVYFDSGPADFFPVDRECHQKISSQGDAAVVRDMPRTR